MKSGNEPVTASYHACSGAESGKAGEVSFLILYRADAASYQKYNK